MGVVLASAGSAVGLGNIWRFPTEVGRNGGAAFILVYLAFVFLLAMPVMVCEFVVGRRSGANTVGAYRRLSGGGTWVAAGYMGVVAGVLILSFYSVVAGWTLRYATVACAGGLSAGRDFGAVFSGFVAHPWKPLAFQAVFLLMTHLVVARGVERGIERFSKLMMPLLLLIIVMLTCCSLSMPGAGEGLGYLLRPDFGKVTPGVVVSALGQAFFSLSVGVGCLTTYASYFSRETNLVRSAVGVCAIDSVVAVLAGFIIFPAVFSVEGVSVDAGPGLVFITLPSVFNSAFGGLPALSYVFSCLFYVLLLLAALTSTISMHEIATAFIREQFGLGRRKAATLVTAVCMVLGAACSLSFGPWSGVRVLGMGFFDLFDFLTAKYIMPLGGLAITVFVGWWLNRSIVRDELSVSSLGLSLLLFLIRWVAPVGVGVIFVSQLIYS